MNPFEEKHQSYLEEKFGSRVSFHKTERKLYGHDIAALPSLIRPLVGNTTPDAVVQPETEKELVELVRWARENNIPLTPRGKELKVEYDRLFSGLREESICLVESFYKPWTRDAHCPLPFASERGLLMGDSAIHLLAIYQQCGLEVSEEFKGYPDHIVMKLEFLSL